MPDAVQLYLVRHAIAHERGEAWPDDTLRPLTDAGQLAVALGRERRELHRLRAVQQHLGVLGHVDLAPVAHVDHAAHLAGAELGLVAEVAEPVAERRGDLQGDLARGELRDLLVRWGRSAWITLSSGRPTFFAVKVTFPAGTLVMSGRTQ